MEVITCIAWALPIRTVATGLAVVVDEDQLVREVMAPRTEGLARDDADDIQSLDDLIHGFPHDRYQRVVPSV